MRKSCAKVVENILQMSRLVYKRQANGLGRSKGCETVGRGPFPPQTGVVNMAFSQTAVLSLPNT